MLVLGVVLLIISLIFGFRAILLLSGLILIIVALAFFIAMLGVSGGIGMTILSFIGLIVGGGLLLKTLIKWLINLIW